MAAVVVLMRERAGASPGGWAQDGSQHDALRKNQADALEEKKQADATACDDTHSLLVTVLTVGVLGASAGNALRRAIRAPCPRCAARPAPQPTSLVSRSTTRARADRRGRVGLLLGQTAHCTCVRAGLRHDVNARCAGLRAVWLAAHDPRRGRIEELGRGE